MSKIHSPEKLNSARSSNKNSFLENKRSSLKKHNEPLRAILKNLAKSIKKPTERAFTDRKSHKVSKHSSLENTRVKYATKNIVLARSSASKQGAAPKQVNRSQLNSSRGIKSDRILLTKHKEIYTRAYNETKNKFLIKLQ
eukprot:TRINITY_DN16284_c0_g1_i1.p2 TRINITY_DN16284_c0_g1~~TRINITY_DN16284_c0_g1_i1.p2  ORF type:complete len:140 (+),score=23.11 TRINITY_DN16284_c0_g1_i1:390-809(+)